MVTLASPSSTHSSCIFGTLELVPPTQTIYAFNKVERKPFFTPSPTLDRYLKRAFLTQTTNNARYGSRCSTNLSFPICITHFKLPGVLSMFLSLKYLESKYLKARSYCTAPHSQNVSRGTSPHAPKYLLCFQVQFSLPSISPLQAPNKQLFIEHLICLRFCQHINATKLRRNCLVCIFIELCFFSKFPKNSRQNNVPFLPIHVHILILRTCKYFRFHGKGELLLQMNVGC